jgi:hypothetical protein
LNGFVSDTDRLVEAGSGLEEFAIVGFVSWEFRVICKAR